jgi:hypothetical protein
LRPYITALRRLNAQETRSANDRTRQTRVKSNVESRMGIAEVGRCKLEPIDELA